MGKVFILIIRVYQWTLSPVLGLCCRFTPSCSEYMVQAVQKHGFFRGVQLGIKRVIRCSPRSLGGYDPVPKQKKIKPEPSNEKG